ncbi:MAG: hypothetical protein V7640_3054 [Betaproteobacteria bacterium]
MRSALRRHPVLATILPIPSAISRAPLSHHPGIRWYSSPRLTPQGLSSPTKPASSIPRRISWKRGCVATREVPNTEHCPRAIRPATSSSRSVVPEHTNSARRIRAICRCRRRHCPKRSSQRLGTGVAFGFLRHRRSPSNPSLRYFSHGRGTAKCAIMRICRRRLLRSASTSHPRALRRRIQEHPSGRPSAKRRHA